MATESTALAGRPRRSGADSVVERASAPTRPDPNSLSEKKFGLNPDNQPLGPLLAAGKACHIFAAISADCTRSFAESCNC